jgi:prepilin-type N-terminal cleavage/methylation domain-containing protein
MKTMKSGFTLMELIITIMILAIVAAVVVTQVSSTGSSLKVASASQVVTADLLYAQSYAMAHQQSVYVVFSKGGGSTPDQYQLQSPLGTALSRAAGGNPTVTLGSGQTTLPNVTFSFPSFTMGFDSIGQPMLRSGSTDALTTSAIAIGLQSTGGTYPTTLTVQPYCGEVAVQ